MLEHYQSFLTCKAYSLVLNERGWGGLIMGGGSKFQNLEKVQNLLKRLGVVNFYVEAMKTTWFKCPINVISLNYQVNNFTTKML